MTLRQPVRSGAVVPLVAFLLVFLMALAAFAVDIGYICVVEKEVQNAADAAALAGASQLLPRSALTGAANWAAAAAAARDEAQKFAALNKGGGVALTVDRNDANDPDGDVVVGTLANPADLSSPLDTQAGAYNSVRVHVRRDAAKNGSLGLFFAPVFGFSSQDLGAAATATYEGGVAGFRIEWPGRQTVPLLPFTVSIDTWNSSFTSGPDNWSYDPQTQQYARGGDGIRELNLYPTKGNAPGNFGTVDLGAANNSTADISRQIRNGLNDADLNAMGGKVALGPDGKLTLQGDTGVSAGFKDDLLAIRGQPRIIPLYNKVTGQGNNTYYTVVAFAGVIITDVQLTSGNKYVTIQPEYVTTPTALGGGTSYTSRFVTKPLKLTR